MTIKTILVSIFLGILFVGNSFGQVPYYDALNLNNHVKNNKLVANDTVLSIIGPYFDPKIQGNDDVIVQLFNKNPFFKINVDIKRSGVPFTAAKTVLSQVSGLNVTNIADGLAKFLVERTKQELSIAFFEKFKNELEKPEYKDLQTLFPETYKVLLIIDTDIFSFEPYIATLRQAIEKDLSLLLVKLPDVIDNHREFFKENRQPESILRSGLFIIDGLARGDHPAAIVSAERLQTLATDVDSLQNVRNGLRLFSLFSNSIRSKNHDRYWVSADSLKLLKGRALRIYMALIYVSIPQDNDIEFRILKCPTVIDTIGIRKSVLPRIAQNANSIESEFQKIRRYLNDLIAQAEIVEGYIKKLKSADLTEKNFQDYFAFFSATNNVVKRALAVPDMAGFDLNNSVGSSSGKFLAVAELVQQISLDIRSRQYGSAVLNTTVLLDTVLADRFKFRKPMLKYGTFMANVAAAQNSNEVKDAIEAIALPAGSARIKRKSSFNIALNTYVGLFGGRESIDENGAFVGGVTTPLGVAFSHGGKCGSISLFLSFIDIGAVTAYRFEDDSTEALPEITLKNIIAPGANIIWGIPGVPVSIGWGFQMGPALRDIINDDLDTLNSVNYRWHGFLAIDIPILNFYTRTK